MKPSIWNNRKSGPKFQSEGDKIIVNHTIGEEDEEYVLPSNLGSDN